MASLGKAVIEFSADTAKFIGDIGRMGVLFEKNMTKIESIAKVAAGAATVTGVALTALAKSAIDDMDAMGKLSQRIGVSTEALSGLKFAADLSDVSMESLSQAMKKLSVNMFDTQAGTGEAKDAFRALGVQVTQADGTLKSADAVLREVATRFASMEDGAGKTALAVKLFGKSGADLIPMLNEGATGLQRMHEEMARLGLTVMPEAARKAQDFNDNLARLAKTIPALGIEIASFTLGPLVDLTNKLRDASNAAGGFWNFMSNPFASGISDPGPKILELEGKLGKLKAMRDDLSKPTFANSLNDIVFGDVGDLNIQIKAIEKQLEFLNKMQGMKLDRLSADSIHRAPRLPVPAPRGPVRLGDDIVGRQWAEQIEAEAKIMSEAAAATDKFNQTMRDNQYWENMGMTKEQHDNLIKGLNTLEEYDIKIGQLKGGFDGMGNAIERVAKTSTNWGFTFNSSLENLIVKGGEFSDVLKALGEDIARMAVRKAITEPLGNAVGGIFGNIFSGIFGGGGGLVGSFASGTDFVPRDGLAMVHQGEAIIPASENAGGATNINVSLNVGSLDPRNAAAVILANEPVITAMFRRAAKQRGQRSPV